MRKCGKMCWDSGFGQAGQADYTELFGHQVFQGFFVKAGIREMETYSVDYHNY